nr:neuraminidase-like domain-containing protein [uncultured Moellerella sp.]
MSQYIPQRDKDHVAAGSVASMFSPAAYLTKLWLEAKALHPAGHFYGLQARRPDLQNLRLSQDNLDKPVSTLTLSNELLANLCQTNANFASYDALLEAMSTYSASSGRGFHQPFEMLRGLLASLPDEPDLLTDITTANLLYAGIAPADKNSLAANEIARQAQIWRLTHFYQQIEEDARVICGLPLSENDTETTASQFKRLFNGLDATALLQMTAADQRKAMMQAFDLNDNQMVLIQSLSGWDGTTALNSVAAISALYAWRLLSWALDCSLAELQLLKNIENPTNPWQRFDSYKKILMWLEVRDLTVNDLVLMTTISYSSQPTPSMNSLIQEVARNVGGSNEEMNKGLIDAVSSSLELASPRRAKALLDWLDTDLLASDINSQRFLAAITSPISTPMVIYLNRLAQHALVMNNLGLTDDMVEMMAQKPAIVTGGNSASFTLDRLRNLAHFKSATEACGVNGTAFINKLANNTLKVSDLALYLNVEVSQLTSDPAATLLIFSSLVTILKNYELSQRSGFSLSNLTSLRQLRADSPYATWKSVAEQLLATLDEPQAEQIRQQLAEKLSQALSGYLCQLNAPIRYILIHCQPTPGRDYFDATELKVMSNGINLATQSGVTVSSSTDSWWPDTPKSALIDGNTSTRAASGAAVGNSRYWVLVDLKRAYSQISTVEFYTSNPTRVQNYALSVLPEYALPAGVNAATMPDYNSVMQIAGAQHGTWVNLSSSNNQYTLPVKTRLASADLNALASYLLIDPLLSGQTQTSRLAWGIASVQQYIIRCLSGDEPDVVTAAKDSQFFADWDTYNKRYSLWAGLARLLYEPENSIDPALRLRRSEAFKNLQALLDSGQLNEESADDAFLSYLTEFEQLAELDVIGAYHDTMENYKGTTWFIGRSKGTPYTWYWRSLDHSKVVAGTIPSQAWTGWEKIDLPINLTGNLIKPLVYNSRLHLLWLERQDKTTRNASGVDVAVADCTLKVAYRRYDGSWSMPAESQLALTGLVQTAFNTKASLNQLSLFCTEETSRKSILLILNTADQNVNLTKDKINGYFTNSSATNTPCSSSYLDTALANLKSIMDTYGEDYSFVATPNNGASVPIAITSIYKKKFFNWSLYSASLSSDFPSRLRDMAARGIKQIFTPETQQQIDPAIADGFYLNLVFSPAANRQSYLLQLRGGTGPIISQGAMSSTTDTIIKCYVPVAESAKTISIYVQLRPSAIFSLDFTKDNTGLWGANFSSSANQQVKKYYVRNPTLEPLAFTGTFGDYYWELFYHVPLLISQRLQQLSAYNIASKWLKYIINLAGIPPLTAPKVRYILLRRKSSTSYFLTSELEAFVNGENVARQAALTYGPPLQVAPLNIKDLINGDRTDRVNINQGDVIQGRYYCWVQVDLGALYSIDTIKLWPYTGSQSSLIPGSDVGCAIHASPNDMSSWANTHSEPTDTDPRYPLIGLTTEIWNNYPERNNTYNLRTQVRYWTTLPLQDDDAWDSLGSDIRDPDLIAETDPMHYKLASFMRYLDLLIAQADSAYRLLEPDTLVEAQMWYQQALDALGEEPANQAESSWNNPALKDLTDLTSFRPQENEKLSGYWQLLRQRLYNLRHNLTIDGLARNLLLYAPPANPQALLSAVTAVTSGGEALPSGVSVRLRFQPALIRARELAEQLIRFGSKLQNIVERQDGEAMNQLLQNQANQLFEISQQIQERTLTELDAMRQSLSIQSENTQLRRDYYSRLYNENISSSEQSALALNTSAAALQIAGGASYILGGGLDSAPNLFGLAAGGSRWGGIANGIGTQLTNAAFALSTTASVLTETDAYRRRREEYKLQLDSAENELNQLTIQQDNLKKRREAALMQQNYVLTQQRQSNDQLQFLQRKLTNQRLFSWMRSRLSTLFWQLYDLTVTASLQAEEAWRWESSDTASHFIRPAAWQASYSGLLCGEALMVDLARLEAAWQNWNIRTLEVNRTVSLEKLLSSAKTKPNVGGVEIKGVNDAISKLMAGTTSLSWDAPVGTGLTYKLLMQEEGLNCVINLAALNIVADYPDNYGTKRRIKSIAVSLPALIGPYQDVQGILSYSETGPVLPAGQDKIALSHGINDSGLFQLDFNDPRYLPFDGIKLPKPSEDKGGNLTLRFPNISGTNKDEAQKLIIQSLNDIVFHIKYTIRS